MPLFELSSSVQLPAKADPPLIIDRKTAALNLTILITGGSGTGVFVPLIRLEGETNESTTGIRTLGASAGLTWPWPNWENWVQAGDPYASAGQSWKPLFDCRPNGPDERQVQFEYGVPQVLALEAKLEAAIDLTGSDPKAWPNEYNNPLRSSLCFDGIQILGSTAHPPGSVITVNVALRVDSVTDQLINQAVP